MGSCKGKHKVRSLAFEAVCMSCGSNNWQKNGLPASSWSPASRMSGDGMGTGAFIRCIINRISIMHGVGSQLVEVAIVRLISAVFFSYECGLCHSCFCCVLVAACLYTASFYITVLRKAQPAKIRLCLLQKVLTCLGQSHTCLPIAWCPWMDPSSSYF